MATQTTIVWFRHDLRIHDNPALQAAADLGTIVPIYIVDTQSDDAPVLGGASKWWLHHSLKSLNESLNNKLQCFIGDPQTLIPQLIEQYNASGVVWNRTYEAWQITRDKKIKSELKAKNILCTSFNGSLLWEPWEITKGDGTPYKVFTPYYRRGCLHAKTPRYPIDAPSSMSIDEKHSAFSRGIDDLKLLPSISWDHQFYNKWQPGEKGAKHRLTAFLNDAATRYKIQRDVPSMKGTSLLSAHLRFGEVSPNQIWYATLDKFEGMDQEGIDTFLSEIGWREFSYYMLYHFPNLQTENYSPKFSQFPWRKSADELKAWQKGLTGIPIIDAGMRELWQTGYMHNRIRMVVGSFLVKNLLIDWRDGEKWFWDCLCDADMASNSAGWQWVAGCGADAAPYFRVFNAVLQGEKFDKQGEYVKHYCPELALLPDKYIHKPWDAPKHILDSAKIVLGETYPKPIVDLKASRVRALEAFATTKLDT